MSPRLFLDIDGVLNTPSTFPLFDPHAVKSFNYLISEVKPKLVISSSWRYLIHGKHMSDLGFQHMLFTHGINLPPNSIVGITVKDEVIKDRSDQILSYVRNYLGTTKWIVLDDLTLQLPENNFVKVNPDVGLTDRNVRELTRKLTLQ